MRIAQPVIHLDEKKHELKERNTAPTKKYIAGHMVRTTKKFLD